ncbi:unnamed protein product [Schistocephalus solidus]|uniref:UBA domain-containing protein n=1 Tax=Schistocephalus solidus TaxID=70667 RepID=A0A183SJN0_SCHSO|nr:unnamed protein product [Schistocephalus solidus]
MYVRFAISRAEQAFKRDHNLAELLAMGYSISEATSALEAARDNLTKATDLLASKQLDRSLSMRGSSATAPTAAPSRGRGGGRGGRSGRASLMPFGSTFEPVFPICGLFSTPYLPLFYPCPILRIPHSTSPLVFLVVVSLFVSLHFSLSLVRPPPSTSLSCSSSSFPSSSSSSSFLFHLLPFSSIFFPYSLLFSSIIPSPEAHLNEFIFYSRRTAYVTFLVLAAERGGLKGKPSNGPIPLSEFMSTPLPQPSRPSRSTPSTKPRLPPDTVVLARAMSGDYEPARVLGLLPEISGEAVALVIYAENPELEEEVPLSMLRTLEKEEITRDMLYPVRGAERPSSSMPYAQGDTGSARYAQQRGGDARSNYSRPPRRSFDGHRGGGGRGFSARGRGGSYGRSRVRVKLRSLLDMLATLSHLTSGPHSAVFVFERFADTVRHVFAIILMHRRGALERVAWKAIMCHVAIKCPGYRDFGAEVTPLQRILFVCTIVGGLPDAQLTSEVSTQVFLADLGVVVMVATVLPRPRLSNLELAFRLRLTRVLMSSRRSGHLKEHSDIHFSQD